MRGSFVGLEMLLGQVQFHLVEIGQLIRCLLVAGQGPCSQQYLPVILYASKQASIMFGASSGC